MEINSTINLLQDVPVAEQTIDLSENVEQSPELDFEKVLAQAIPVETELFQNTCNPLPVTGNELPLQIEPKSKEATFLDMLEKPEVKAEVVTEIEEEEQNALPFIMTQLLIDIPNDPIVMSDKTIPSIPTMMLTNDQSTGAVAPFLAPVLQDELMAKTIEDESLTTNPASGFKVMLNEAPEIQKQNRVLHLVSEPFEQLPNQLETPKDTVQQALLVDAEAVEPKSVEFIKALSESKLEDIEGITPEKPQLIVNELFSSRETVKTMVLPSGNVADDQFANIFEQKLMDNVTSMVRRNENVTQIQIDPPELGKIEITIEQNDDKTDIRFFAQVDQTKQLIENTMDKLKMQFEQSGLMLGQVDVNSGNQGQQSLTRSFAADPQSKLSQEDDVIAGQQTLNLQNNQLLDLYI